MCHGNFKLILTPIKQNIQCHPLKWITLGRIKSDNIDQMMQLPKETFILKKLNKKEKYPN
jgi:hypothetical protein